MVEVKDKVFVADIDELVVVDINTAQMIEKYPIPGAILMPMMWRPMSAAPFMSQIPLAARVYRWKNHKVDVYLEVRCRAQMASGQNRIDSWWRLYTTYCLRPWQKPSSWR